MSSTSDDADDPQRALHETERLRGAAEVVREVELVAADVGTMQLLADDDARHRAVRRAGARRTATTAGPASDCTASRSSSRDDLLGQPGGGEVLRRELRRRAVDAERGDHVARGLLGEGVAHARHEVLELDAVTLHGRGVERRLRGLRRALRVGEHLLLARLEQVVLDGERHPDAGDQDRERRERERDQDRAEAQRPPPQAREAVRPRAPVPPRRQRWAGCRDRRVAGGIGSLTRRRRRGSRRRAPS